MKEVKIPKIKEGIVIDHLNVGTALDVIRDVLEIGSGEESITLGVKYTSDKMGFKDVIKIENKTLSKAELDKISLIDPNATISIIENYQVKDKFKVNVPDSVEHILKCPHENCITNNQTVPTKFKIISKDPLKLKCHYCEGTIGKEDIKLL